MSATVTMIAAGKVEWVRVLLAALMVEAALFGIAIVFYLIPGGTSALLYVIPPSSLGLTLYFGFWVARSARRHHLLRGALVGIIAALIYMALTRGKALPLAYTAADALKVIGGAMGGLIAKHRQS